MEEEIPAGYQKGFNEGYIITEHLPDISAKLSAIDSKSARLEGFKDGRKQFVLDQVKDNRPKWMNHKIDNTITNDKSDRDFDLNK